MSFFDELRNLQNETRTTNGDVAFRSTFNANLDFFGLVGAMRGQYKEANDLFIPALLEDEKLAAANLFHLRNVRGGLGERDLFRAIFVEAVEVRNNFINTMKLIPKYGRWDDLIAIANMYCKNQEAVRKEAVKIIKEQLEKDLADAKNDKPISLLAKWLPSANTSSKHTRSSALKLISDLGMSERMYRKTLSKLRAYLDVLEVKMSKREFEVDYSKVPGKALRKYMNAFYRHDEDGITAFKNKLERGEVKANVGTLYPYEIVHDLSRNSDKAEMYNALWEQYPKEATNKKILVVRDGSGSMTTNLHGSSATILDVATSLAIYSSERLAGEFKNKFITFSESPKLVELKGQNLFEKVREIKRYSEVANTNIEKTYNLIFEASLNSNPEDYIDAVLIISDMQFDSGADFKKSTYEAVKEKFVKAGIPFPKMVYWNVNASKLSFPTTDIENAVFVSGMSRFVFDSLMKGEIVDATQQMLTTLSEYEDVMDALEVDKED